MIGRFMRRRWILTALFLLGASALFVVLVVAHRQTRAAVSDVAGFESSLATAETLPAEWKAALLAVEDPHFYRHHGVDLLTPGAGWTTITQALAKRYYFAHFHKGIVTKTWQSFCALVLDRELSKNEQLTLFLNTASFGQGRSAWVNGFPAAAQEFFDKPFNDLTRAEFIELVAVLVAPSDFSPRLHREALAERTRRIDRLLAGQCAPLGFRDVLLDGCR